VHLYFQGGRRSCHAGRWGEDTSGSVPLSTQHTPAPPAANAGHVRWRWDRRWWGQCVVVAESGRHFCYFFENDSQPRGNTGNAKRELAPLFF